MAKLAPSVAVLRIAVRQALSGVRARHGEGALVLVACSGGADSLALAATVAFLAPRMGVQGGLITVDHQLQAGSAQRAAQVAAWANEAGLNPAEVVTVTVPDGPDGPEAAARRARYRALHAAAARLHAVAILLGHTRDDQAETVLLALARGSGPRGLAGMPPRRDLDGVALLRPLLSVSRQATRDACRLLGLRPWDDPHNVDLRYARSRVRAIAMPALVEALGPDVVANLARTAELLAADAAVLDELAAQAAEAARTPAGALRVAELAALPVALRTRVLHAWAAVAGPLTYAHVDALDALVTRWHGQGPIHLPGGVLVRRRGGELIVRSPKPSSCDRPSRSASE